jgi:hypothetical protein
MFREWEFDLYIKYLSFFNVIVLSYVNLLKDSIDIGLIRGIVLFLLAAYFFATKRVWSKTFNYLMYFSFYILLLGILTYVRYDFFPDKVLKVFLGSISFAYGIFFINSYKRFVELNRMFIISIIIIILTIVLANITGVDYKLYAETGFSLGGQGVNIAKNLTIFIMPFPIFFLLNKKKGFNIALRALYLLCLLIILISLKRGAMVGLLLGTLTYFIISAKRGKFLRNSLLVVIAAFLAYPFYEPILQETFKAREENFSLEEENVESEGRYMEYRMTLDDIKNKSFVRTIIGEGVQSEAKYFNINRFHHTDFFSILFGAGVIGLILYILTYYKAYVELKYFRFLEPKYPLVREIRAVCYALIFSIIGLSISGVYHTIDLRGFAFLYIGGCLGLLRSFLYDKTRIHR